MRTLVQPSASKGALERTEGATRSNDAKGAGLRRAPLVAPP